MSTEVRESPGSHMNIGDAQRQQSEGDVLMPDRDNDQAMETIDALDGINVEALEEVDASILRGKVRGGIEIPTTSPNPATTPDAKDDDVVIAAKMSRDIAEQIKRAAREDDRTVSHWIRRHFTEFFQQHNADGSTR